MKLTVKTEYPATKIQQQMLEEREEREAAELERLYRVWLEEQDEDILYVPTKKRQNP